MPENASFQCHSCGAALPVKGDEQSIQCPYCGSTNIVPEALRSPHSKASPLGMSQTPPKRRPAVYLAVVLILVLLVAVSTALSNLPPRTAPVTPIIRPLDGALPRAVRYAGLEMTVTQATISNQTPANSGQTRQYRSDQAYAYLDMRVNNPLTKDSVYLSAGQLRLELGNGNAYVDAYGWAESVAPQSAKDAHLVFAVPIESDWQGAKLVVGEAGMTPAVLPLEGPLAPPEYPLSLPAGGEVTAQQIVFALLAASLDLDSHGARSEVGQRFLILALRVTNQDPAPGGVALIPDYFRLLVDGIPQAPLQAPIELLHPQSALGVEVVFVLPATARRVELQVGEVRHAGTAVIPIDLQGAKP